MKNIRSSKGQDGFIGALVGLIAGAFILYIVFMTLAFVVGFAFVAKEGKETREYRATFTDTEWILKEEYELAMGKCSSYPDRKYANFDCNWTEAEWATTPPAIKVILKRLSRHAEHTWVKENTTYIVQDNGSTRRWYSKPTAENPCTYTYLDTTYNCKV